MLVEKRNRIPAIPMDLEKYLNDEQLLSLHHAESYGWYLAFVRRPLFLEAIPVLYGPTPGQVAIIESNGDINQNPRIIIRH